MVAWSTIARAFMPKAPLGQNVLNKSVLTKKATDLAVTQVRNSGGHGPKSFVIVPSNWQWDKFKDLLHFYTLVGALPVIAIVTYTNLYIGPAQLTHIPENYEPKYWEYYPHPITRFIARYIMRNPQQEYEKFCHELYEEGEKIRLRKLQNDVKKKMAERLDYQAWYYRPALVKYARGSKKFFEEHNLTIGT